MYNFYVNQIYKTSSHIKRRIAKMLYELPRALARG
jgi:hypothetical protein